MDAELAAHAPDSNKFGSAMSNVLDFSGLSPSQRASSGGFRFDGDGASSHAGREMMTPSGVMGSGEQN
jgi:hypothetical protein